MTARPVARVSAAPDRRLLASISVLAIATFVYLALALRINGGTIFTASFVPYYSRLMEAVAHGRLWIGSEGGFYDLAEFQGRAYLYWGLSPLLLIAPFYFLGHGWQFDVAYTLVFGLANVVALLWMIREAESAAGITLRPSAVALAGLLFAFASPNFYMSLQGRIWHTNQIAATLFCLLSLAFTFRFLRRRSLVDVMAATTLYVLAVDARMTFVAVGPLLLFAIVDAWRRDRAIGAKAFAASTTIGLLGLGAWTSYNYVRFGNVLETGYTYMHHAERFREAVKAGTLWSLKYVPHNWEYYIRHWPFSRRLKHFEFDVEGNSILVLYPWTLLALALPFVWRRISPAAKPLFAVTLLVALIQFTSEMTFYSTGWTQVGARYFLDSVPVLFVLLLPVIDRTPRLLLAAGVLIGLVFNVVGMLRFYYTPIL